MSSGLDQKPGNAPLVTVHPTALVESSEVGPGTRIFAFAHVMEGAVIGSNCKLGDHVFVESGARVGNRVTLKNGVAVWDGVTLEDEVFVGPSAVFTNVTRPRAAIKRTREEFLPTIVRRGATIGANATILCGLVVGEHAMIGAGAVVTRDVAPHAIVVGSPARPAGWACACGESLPQDLRCDCGAEHELTPEGIVRQRRSER